MSVNAGGESKQNPLLDRRTGQHAMTRATAPHHARLQDAPIFFSPSGFPVECPCRLRPRPQHLSSHPPHKPERVEPLTPVWRHGLISRRVDCQPTALTESPARDASEARDNALPAGERLEGAEALFPLSRQMDPTQSPAHRAADALGQHGVSGALRCSPTHDPNR